MSAAAKTFQSNVIYSLLQTETYALALLNGDNVETAARQHGSSVREDGSACLLETPVHGFVTVSPKDVVRVVSLWEAILVAVAEEERG